MIKLEWHIVFFLMFGFVLCCFVLFCFIGTFRLKPSFSISVYISSKREKNQAKVSPVYLFVCVNRIITFAFSLFFGLVVNRHAITEIYIYSFFLLAFYMLNIKCVYFLFNGNMFEVRTRKQICRIDLITMTRNSVATNHKFPQTG